MSPGYMSLWQSNARKKLEELARYPYDLTARGALQADDRLLRYCCAAGPVRLHYGLQRVDDRVLDALQSLADELQLVEQFRNMRRGAVINAIDGYESENRQVLHTASRGIFEPQPAAAEATKAAKAELEKLRTFLAEVDAGVLCNLNGEPFDTMVHVGIGGSDLGPRAMHEALKPYGIQSRKVYFIANVDPDDAASVLSDINLSTTLVNIVSKSGSTLETLTNEKLVCRALEKAGLEPSRHCLAVTGKNSPMDDPGKYLRSFYMEDYIGGRFSSTSMVGAVVLGFHMGYDRVVEFLKGASALDRAAEVTGIRENLPLLLALIGIWNRNFLGYPTLAILPYSQALHRFPAHLQQCDMESNGKSVDRQGREAGGLTGPIIWGEPGTNGQHAFYQLLHQGPAVVPSDFIGFYESQYGDDIQVQGTTSQQKLLANMYAQMVALAQGQAADNPNKVFPGNRPSSLLVAQKLTPGVMGALLALYEAKIVFQGFAWNINSFDQEGVQLGKVLATDFLAAMRGGEMGPRNLPHDFLEALSDLGSRGNSKTE